MMPRPVADILAEALANGAAPYDVELLRTAAKIATDGTYLVPKQLRGALSALEQTGIDPADIRSLYARCARPKRKPKADGGGKRRAGKGGTPNTPPDVAAPVATTPAPGAAPVVPADGLPIPRQRADTLCDSEESAAQAISRTVAGRLAFIHQSGDWLTFGPRGWKPVHRTTVEEACTDFARLNIGSLDKNGDLNMTPRSTGRKVVGRSIAQLLEPMCGTELAEWDTTRNVIMLPDGVLLDVFTGEQRLSVPADRIRRRVSVAPASEPEYNRSVFRRVIEYVVPDRDERAYLQRRLGAALVDSEGMDDLPWLFGPSGCGKGTLIRALKQTLGTYAGGVPINELLRGMNKGHSAWLARLAGCRFLFADDVPVGRYLDDATINKLLGSETTAQHMRSETFDFRLHAPLICTSNGPPQITSTNVRRLRPIQCGASIPIHEQNPGVRASMSTDPEIAACLRWLLDGARDWRVYGCPAPATCIERADEAAAASPIAEFTGTFGPGDRIESGEVFQRWQAFKRGLGEHAGSHRAMVGELRAASWTDTRSHGVRYLLAPRVPHGAASLISPICARASTHIEVIAKAAPSGTRATNAPESIDDAAPPDLPPGALGTVNGSGGGEDQVPPPLDARPKNPATPPPPGQPKEQSITMTDRTTPRPPAETPAARGDDPLPPDTDPAQIERLRALPAAAGSQCSPLGKIRAMQTAFGLPLTSWNADKAAQRDAARATLAVYVDAA